MRFTVAAKRIVKQIAAFPNFEELGDSPYKTWSQD
jgi:hypothetical protein